MYIILYRIKPGLEPDRLARHAALFVMHIFTANAAILKHILPCSLQNRQRQQARA